MRMLFWTAHLPLLEVRVKPDPFWDASGLVNVSGWGMGGGRIEDTPEGVAVNVAQVPVVYHVPLLMMHPFCELPLVTIRVPLPENEVPGVFVGGVIEVVVVGDGVRLLLGRYLIPVAGQLDLDPSKSRNES